MKGKTILIFLLIVIITFNAYKFNMNLRDSIRYGTKLNGTRVIMELIDDVNPRIFAIGHDLYIRGIHDGWKESILRVVEAFENEWNHIKNFFEDLFSKPHIDKLVFDIEKSFIRTKIKFSREWMRYRTRIVQKMKNYNYKMAKWVEKQGIEEYLTQKRIEETFKTLTDECEDVYEKTEDLYYRFQDDITKYQVIIKDLLTEEKLTPYVQELEFLWNSTHDWMMETRAKFESETAKQIKELDSSLTLIIAEVICQFEEFKNNTIPAIDLYGEMFNSHKKRSFSYIEEQLHQNLTDYALPDYGKQLYDLALSGEFHLTLWLEAYYNIFKMYQQALSSGLVLYVQMSADPILIEMFVVQTMLKFSLWLLKETIFRISHAGAIDLNFWTFNKIWGEFAQAQFFDTIGQTLSILMIIRVSLNVLSLPYLFVINYLYFLGLVVIYGFYVVIMNISTEMRYKVELKVEATVVLAKEKPKALTVTDHFTLIFLQNALSFVPWLYRIYRQQEEFRPFKGLVAPNKKRYFGCLISLIPYLIISVGIDFILLIGFWLIVWLWISPYLKNRSISQEKWQIIVDASKNQYVLFNGHQIYESHSYFYNVLRIWALIWGWYDPSLEYIESDSNIFKFFKDIFKAAPSRIEMISRRNKLPIEAFEELDSDFIKEDYTTVEQVTLYLRYLKRQGSKINPNAELLELVPFATNINNPEEAALAEMQLDRKLYEKFGVHYKAPINISPKRSEIGRVYGQDAEIIPKDFVINHSYSMIEALWGRQHLELLDSIVGNDVSSGLYASRGYDDVLYQILYRLNLRTKGRDLKIVRPLDTTKYQIDCWKTVDSIELFYCLVALNPNQKFDAAEIVYTDDMNLENVPLLEYIRAIMNKDFKMRKIYGELGEELYDEHYPEFNYSITHHHYKLKEEPMWYSYVLKIHETNEFKQKYGIQEGDLFTVWKLAEIYGKVSNPKEKFFVERITLLESLPQGMTLKTGRPYSTLYPSDDIVRQVKARISRSPLHYSIFFKWINSFTLFDQPRATLWFLLNNSLFLKRFFYDEEVLSIFRSEGIDINTELEYVSIIEEQQPNIQDSFIENVKRELKELTRKDIEDDYVELDDWRERSYSYGNHESIKIEYPDLKQETFGGLRIKGTQDVWHHYPMRITLNKPMEDLIHQFGIANTRTYVIVNAEKKYMEEAVRKYTPKEVTFDPDTKYNGYSFRTWMTKWMDYFYNTKGEKYHTRSISSFSEKDLGNNPRAFPGPLTRRAGIIYKNHNLEESKKWAEDYRRSQFTINPIDHAWALLPIPKAAKVGSEEIRAVLAPEMYFYINQYLLLEPFVKLSKYSLVTGDFNPFFGHFDEECRSLIKDGFMIESLDLKNQGGSIPTFVYKEFVRWWSTHLEMPADHLILERIYSNIFKGDVLVPKVFGGYVLEKKSGYGDGPYGTAQFDTWVMIYYYLANIWMNCVREEVVPAAMDLGKFVSIRSHADNWIHSHAMEYDKYLRWNTRNLVALGQTVKGEICRSADILDHELMGFSIREYKGYYVGTRNLAKTIKSLIFNKKSFVSHEDQLAYEAGIIRSLLLVDCHNKESLLLLNRLIALRNVQPMAIDVKVKNRLLLVSAYTDPRDAWIQALPFSEGEYDPDEMPLY